MMIITTRTIVNRYLLFISIHVSFLFVAFQNCSAKDNSTITSTQVITDSQTLISSGQVFKLGFFNPPNSTNHYVGIWYTKFPVQTIVWVANRNNPIKDTSGTLGIATDGNLVISNGRGVVLWTTNISNAANANNTVVELLDTGNLVLSLINDRTRVLWQSFDLPTDTLLPQMKIGASSRQELTSWKNESDPSQGIFSVGLELADGIPQLVLSSNGSKYRHWRSGPWNSIVFIGIPGMTNGYNDGFYLTKDDQDGSMYMSFNYADKTTIRRFVIDHRGVLLGLNWFEGSNEWTQLWSSQENECEVYGKCGPFGRCNPLNSPICSCLPGFKPMSDNEWDKGNWSGGCVRNTPLRCQNNLNDGFLKLGSVKVPDFASSFWLGSPTIEDCNRTCLSNCSCIAYSYDSGIGCMTWVVKDLVDIQVFDETGADLYIYSAEKNNTDLSEKKNPNRVLLHRNLSAVVVVITVLVGILAIIICTNFFWRWLAKRKNDGKVASDLNNVHGETPGSNMLGDNPDQLKIFKFEELAIDTNEFSRANMLGQGGFGQVYKAKLLDGQEIAVKRLSKGSIQGLEEFKNEVLVISKVQHRNLVRLLGCCLEGDEKMLVYEYMPNKSLDAFLFDATKGALLDWKKRFQIIEGISRGILYLHRDSRLRVIHRDLKVSNILLDEDLNPPL
ncbi:G-type lectin S-receptor-like serine/threonine-protein kinase At1g11300 [Papaver somniferum]|uniref:G-type lectin S-receptor-like serine/threonine-protein kinase At1g11300 n=1 Tax=Papaver somniferum TaxID=3469 RepID=UPI000E6F7DAA|nr:G-type lectin S-receptor-like serine/threonine-protein kinase At1g11300 [Papaver somniferum]